VYVYIGGRTGHAPRMYISAAAEQQRARREWRYNFLKKYSL
jgi:hypothetical protein